MRFGEMLIKERTDRGMSLRELGKVVELSPIYLSDIERGNRKPPALGTIVRIATTLGLDPVPFLRAAMKERDSVELPLRNHSAPIRHETAFLLARFWDQADDDALASLKSNLQDYLQDKGHAEDGHTYA